MDIGKPKRKIIVEPIEIPAPVEIPQEEPAREKVPVKAPNKEPLREKSSSNRVES